MFRGLEIRQLQAIVALLAALFLGLIAGRWTGPREASTPMLLSGDFREHPRGTLVLDDDQGLKTGAVIDINAAGQKDFDRLPGVGMEKAELIVKEREQNGPFKSLEDLSRVSGIGDKTVERLRPFLTVTTPPPSPPAAEPSPTPPPPAAAPPAPTVTATKTPAIREKPLETAPVHVNSAPVEELERLDLVGPKLAQRIIEERVRNGPFRSEHDLMRRVKGVGQKIVEKNRHLMRFD